MDPNLPADLLLLICEELANQGDFKTLFNCALSSKDLVRSALLWLYRIHNQTIMISSEGNEAEWTNRQHRLWISKWALQWKSIIRSSLGNTAYPYCLYIRSLDLGNLLDLLDDNTFKESAIDSFFAGDMAMFLKVQGTPSQKKTKGRRKQYIRHNVHSILDLVGESITSFVSGTAERNKTSVALEALAGNISSISLPRWAGRLSKLKSMKLWDGAALDGNLAATIAKNCLYFDDLTFYLCMKENADQDLASFFSGLRRNSLQSLEILNANCVGPETMRALNSHSRTLKVLKLGSLGSDSIKNLSLLQNCDSLESLDMTDKDGFIDLEATMKDVFVETVDWLGRCDRLRELSLTNFVNGPAILTQVCLRKNIRLRSLNVSGYLLTNNQEFHKAVSHQTSLESLGLRADAEGSFRDDNDTLVSSICQLSKLKYLNLISTSDYFTTPEIQRLASHLPKLEEISFTGYDMTDDVWPSISNLHYLRTLNFQAVTSVTFDGLLNYISTLKETNQGLLLSLMNQALEQNLSDEEISAVREAIAERVDGKFEFVLHREAAELEFGGSDSD